jgi:large subunit ribosomal protein L33
MLSQHRVFRPVPPAGMLDTGPRIAIFTSFHLRRILRERPVMAKSNTILIKLVSSADTGFYYVTKKNPRAKTEKLELKKYDPIARKHVLFKESKIK